MSTLNPLAASMSALKPSLTSPSRLRPRSWTFSQMLATTTLRVSTLRMPATVEQPLFSMLSIGSNPVLGMAATLLSYVVTLRYTQKVLLDLLEVLAHAPCSLDPMLPLFLIVSVNLLDINLTSLMSDV